LPTKNGFVVFPGSRGLGNQEETPPEIILITLHFGRWVPDCFWNYNYTQNDIIYVLANAKPRDGDEDSVTISFRSCVLQAPASHGMA